MAYSHKTPTFPLFAALGNGVVFVLALLAFLTNERDHQTWAIVAAISLGAHYIARTITLNAEIDRDQRIHE